MDPAELPLRDIHVPDPVSGWPPALGWWLLVGLVIAIVAGALVWRHWRRRGLLRRTALAELARVREAFRAHGDAHRLSRELSVLLRRVCVARFPRQEAAGLAGDAWLAFLDRGLAGSPQAGGFARGAGRVLATGPYDPGVEPGAEALLDLCRTWIARLPPGGGPV